MSMPLVSVLMAVHNGEQYLREAIGSVLNQTYPYFELLVINNGSTDDTAGIARREAEKDQRIHYQHLTEKGKIRAYNEGFRLSKGDYICFMGADDLLPPDSLQKRLNAAKKSVDGFSTCLLRTFSEESQYDGMIYPKIHTQPNYSGGSIFFYRPMANEIFPIPEDLPAEDMWTSLYLRAFAELEHVPEPLYTYRIHGNNSYGYGLTFEAKRDRFLQRMEAYYKVVDRWAPTGNSFINGYVKNYVNGVDMLKNGQTWRLMFYDALPLGDRLKFLMFSSRMLFRLRNVFFRLFSGYVN